MQKGPVQNNIFKDFDKQFKEKKRQIETAAELISIYKRQAVYSQKVNVVDYSKLNGQSFTQEINIEVSGIEPYYHVNALEVLKKLGITGEPRLEPLKYFYYISFNSKGMTLSQERFDAIVKEIRAKREQDANELTAAIKTAKSLTDLMTILKSHGDAHKDMILLDQYLAIPIDEQITHIQNLRDGTHIPTILTQNITRNYGLRALAHQFAHQAGSAAQDAAEKAIAKWVAEGLAANQAADQKAAAEKAAAQAAAEKAAAQAAAEKAAAQAAADKAAAEKAAAEKAAAEKAAEKAAAEKAAEKVAAEKAVTKAPAAVQKSEPPKRMPPPTPGVKAIAPAAPTRVPPAAPVKTSAPILVAANQARPAANPAKPEDLQAARAAARAARFGHSN